MSKSKRNTANRAPQKDIPANDPEAPSFSEQAGDDAAAHAYSFEEQDAPQSYDEQAYEAQSYDEQDERDDDYDDEDREEDARNVTPSWFGRSVPANDVRDMARDMGEQYRSARAHAPLFEQPSPEAYDAYRRRLEERFQNAKRQAAGPIPPFSTMPHDRPFSRGKDEDEGSLRFREWQKKMESRNGQPAQQGRRRARLSPLKIAGLFAVACTIGGVAGVASSNMNMLHKGYAATVDGASTAIGAVLALMQAPPATDTKTADATPAAAAGGSTVLTKKPVRIPRVDVADASGALNNPIPLEIAAVPADPDIPLALKITGLPNDAYLTKGREVADGEWLLKPTEIQGVKLVVQNAQSSQIDLNVAAVEEKTGAQAAPPREMTVALDLTNVTVQPASAPPEVQSNSQPLPQAIPVPQEADNTEAKTLLGKGEALMKTGDLVTARQFFIKAHGLGLAEGAYGAGQTYDPAVYTAMNVRGLEPDAAKAKEWYDKAAAAGYADARKALEKLNAAAQ